MAVRQLALMELSIQVAQLVFTIGWALIDRSVWALIAGRLFSDVIRLIVSHRMIRGRRTVVPLGQGCGARVVCVRPMGVLLHGSNFRRFSVRSDDSRQTRVAADAGTLWHRFCAGGYPAASDPVILFKYRFPVCFQACASASDRVFRPGAEVSAKRAPRSSRSPGSCHNYR